MQNLNPAKLMDGRPLARRTLELARQKVEKIRAATGAVPTLAMVLVGDNPASVAYARMKQRRCEEVGMRSIGIELPAGTTTEELIEQIRRLAEDPGIHGIVVQHPVPASIDRHAAFDTIPLEKDVDGATPAMLGRVVLGMPAYPPCTPAGIMALLREYRVELDGAHAVVIGRSPILGRPMASMLVNAHATVTLCHSRTRSLPDIVRSADIVVAAVGRPRFVEGGWIKPGAVVVDAGYNEGNIGDVDFEAAYESASLITPVPGGVGPVTVATLLNQSCDAAGRQLGVAL